jgi:hypothetical protein
LLLPTYEENDPEEIDKWIKELTRDIKNTLKFYVKREDEENNLTKILKPEGFEILMNYMKKPDLVQGSNKISHLG